MESLFTINDLKENLEIILSTNLLWKNENLHVFIIANPYAGGFTQKKTAPKHLATLISYSKKAKQLPRLVSSIEMNVLITEYSGHAENLTHNIIQTVLNDSKKKNQYLIVTAGGDGTSLEVQNALIKSAFTSIKTKKIVSNKITVLRLPLGTGNDGSDGRTLDETLSRFLKPSHFALQKAIKVSYEGDITPEELQKNKKEIDITGTLKSAQPWYSFNIASVGIDAFITHMTNKTKGILPGNFYQLWVNLAALFYDSQFKPAPMHIEFFDNENNLIHTIDSPIEFCLLGVSGHRTYGSNHIILPSDENACTTTKMKLLSKIINMKAFTYGTHKEKKLSTLLSCEKIKISYNESILAQLDGEVYFITPNMFPLTMEKTEPIIRIIECDDKTLDKGTELLK